MNFRLSSAALAASIVASPLMVSCERQDPGLTEKLSLLEAELRERDEQLTRTQEELQSAEESKSEAAAGPDVDAARSAYAAFIETVRDKVGGELSEAKMDRTSVFPIEGPDPSKPIASKVAFRIVGKNGRAGELMIPLYADASGSWLDPELADAIAKFKAGLAAAPAPASPPVSANPPQQQEPPKQKPKDVMGADRTVDIQWDDPPAAGGQKPPVQTPAPQPAPQPAPPSKPALPPKVMPTDRDVRIDFGD